MKKRKNEKQKIDPNQTTLTFRGTISLEKPKEKSNEAPPTPQPKKIKAPAQESKSDLRVALPLAGDWNSDAWLFVLKQAFQKPLLDNQLSSSPDELLSIKKLKKDVRTKRDLLFPHSEAFKNMAWYLAERNIYLMVCHKEGRAMTTEQHFPILELKLADPTESIDAFLYDSRLASAYGKLEPGDVILFKTLYINEGHEGTDSERSNSQILLLDKSVVMAIYPLKDCKGKANDMPRFDDPHIAYDPQRLAKWLSENHIPSIPIHSQQPQTQDSSISTPAPILPSSIPPPSSSSSTSANLPQIRTVSSGGNSIVFPISQPPSPKNNYNNNSISNGNSNAEFAIPCSKPPSMIQSQEERRRGREEDDEEDNEKENQSPLPPPPPHQPGDVYSQPEDEEQVVQEEEPEVYSLEFNARCPSSSTAASSQRSSSAAVAVASQDLGFDNLSQQEIASQPLEQRKKGIELESEEEEEGEAEDNKLLPTSVDPLEDLLEVERDIEAACSQAKLRREQKREVVLSQRFLSQKNSSQGVSSQEESSQLPSSQLSIDNLVPHSSGIPLSQEEAEEVLNSQKNDSDDIDYDSANEDQNEDEADRRDFELQKSQPYSQAHDRGMTVLSLFDGIGGAFVALTFLGIPVRRYYAVEKDEVSMRICEANFPRKILRVNGKVDIVTITKQDLQDILTHGPIDLIIGGSPCNDLSFLKKDRKLLRGEQSSLFYEYLRILKTVRDLMAEQYPTTKVRFLLENVASMPPASQFEMTYRLWEVMNDTRCFPLDAKRLSAGKRARLYWTNVERSDCAPEDFHKEIPRTLAEVLPPDVLPLMTQAACITTANCAGKFKKHSDTFYFVNRRRFRRYNMLYTKSGFRSFTVREAEKILGFPGGYTRAAGLTVLGNTVAQRTKARYERLGRTFSIPAVAWMLEQLKKDFEAASCSSSSSSQDAPQPLCDMPLTQTIAMINQATLTQLPGWKKY